MYARTRVVVKIFSRSAMPHEQVLYLFSSFKFYYILLNSSECAVLCRVSFFIELERVAYTLTIRGLLYMTLYYSLALSYCWSKDNIHQAHSSSLYLHSALLPVKCGLGNR